MQLIIGDQINYLVSGHELVTAYLCNCQWLGLERELLLVRTPPVAMMYAYWH